jgi:hypothetical protein
MTQPLGVDDFFALEAGEYLDRLATLAAASGPPNADELVRFTRALRGSALMANQQAIARAAGSLEHLVRGYRDGRRTWDADLSATFREATDTLRTLVERARSWTPDDSARAEKLALHLERSAGGASRPITAPIPAQSEAGVRAFLAREAASLGSVLDQAARGLAGGSVSAEAVLMVVRRMQPLRGLAALTDYPPLPDLLDGIERTVTGVGRLEVSQRDGAARLDAAAVGLARAARDIADNGRPDPDAEEFRRLAALLLAAPEETPIVAIETLFFADEDGIVQRGATPRSNVAASMGAAAIVSRGEHLCQAADEIAQAGAGTQRSLRLHLLVDDLRTLATGLPGGLDVAVSSFAVAAESAVLRGAAAADPARYASVIRDAGTRLRSFTEVTQPGSLADAFQALVRAMDGIDMARPPKVAAAPAAPMADELESEIVPIESLAPDEPEEPGVLVAAHDGWDLAASYTSYEALLAGPATSAPPAARAAAFAAPAAAAASPRPTEPPSRRGAEPDVVDIGDLLYRGRTALERADQLRRVLRSAVSSDQPMSAIRPLVDELLDLVELAMAD